MQLFNLGKYDIIREHFNDTHVPSHAIGSLYCLSEVNSYRVSYGGRGGITLENIINE